MSKTAATRITGTVKWFNDEKGFGFITPSGGGRDCFVHYKAVRNMKGRVTLQEGDEVEFEIVVEEKGPRAENVDKIWK